MKLVDVSSRQLIPRWHTSRKHANFSWVGNQEYAFVGLSEDNLRLDDAIENWKRAKNLPNAIELLGIYRSLNNAEGKAYDEVISFLNERVGQLSSSVREVLSPDVKKLDTSEIYSVSDIEIYKIIHKLKEIVRKEPFDALSWNDLAFYYATIGELDKAEKCLTVAYSASKKHPFLARAFSRFLIEIDDPERALSVVSRSYQETQHPFVLSADLALKLQYGLPGANISKANKLLSRYRDNPVYISELAAALGTEEARSGSLKKAKSKFEMATISPTENTISQLHWLGQKHKIDIKPYIKDAALPYEAQAIKYYEAGNYGDCRSSLLKLQEFQPFSDAALVDATYISLSTLNDPDFVLEHSRKFIRHDHSFLLMNNYIVALLEKNMLDDAGAHLKLLISVSDQREYATSVATTGLYFFKRGMFDDARMMYEKTLDIFRKTNDFRSLANASYYYGKEEIKIRKEKGRKLLEESKKVINSHGVCKEILPSINRVLNEYK